MTILKALLPTLFEVSLHSECEMKHSAESTIEAVSASSLLFKKQSQNLINLISHQILAPLIHSDRISYRIPA